jgi:hypothetical protein
MQHHPRHLAFVVFHKLDLGIKHLGEKHRLRLRNTGTFRCCVACEIN